MRALTTSVCRPGRLLIYLMFEHFGCRQMAGVSVQTVAGLFAAAAIFHFSKGRNYQHLAYAALASLMCSGLLRALESFSNQAAWNNPDRYWISILTLVNWVGNVLCRFMACCRWCWR